MCASFNMIFSMINMFQFMDRLSIIIIRRKNLHNQMKLSLLIIIIIIISSSSSSSSNSSSGVVWATYVHVSSIW
ncbi:uncharacterized protein Smp_202510 [Schistosoma mansoni]|uniref:uncharacterized protein n=1 Tax=Schistosoma mansoni TaxID=6183 RepID=UPI00022DC040|nr:uncharacterized protein Smp_202510 [Schistosoma mansoni]|eukprot:XP_018651955.1 uncharacterized protein Smp_202510 [Schistosoma mansoni]